jgi:hypothetical protein
MARKDRRAMDGWKDFRSDLRGPDRHLGFCSRRTDMLGPVTAFPTDRQTDILGALRRLGPLSLDPAAGLFSFIHTCSLRRGPCPLHLLFTTRPVLRPVLRAGRPRFRAGDAGAELRAVRRAPGGAARALQLLRPPPIRPRRAVPAHGAGALHVPRVPAGRDVLPLPVGAAAGGAPAVRGFATTSPPQKNKRWLRSCFSCTALVLQPCMPVCLSCLSVCFSCAALVLQPWGFSRHGGISTSALRACEVTCISPFKGMHRLAKKTRCRCRRWYRCSSSRVDKSTRMRARVGPSCRSSHFLCEAAECENCFVAFGTEEELRQHTLERHSSHMPRMPQASSGPTSGPGCLVLHARQETTCAVLVEPRAPSSLWSEIHVCVRLPSGNRVSYCACQIGQIGIVLVEPRAALQHAEHAQPPPAPREKHFMKKFREECILLGAPPVDCAPPPSLPAMRLGGCASQSRRFPPFPCPIGY